MAFIPSLALNKIITANIVSTSGSAQNALNNAKMHLYQSPVTITHQSTSGSYSESSFTGYSAQSVTWNTAGQDPAGSYTSVGNPCFFQATDAVSAQNAFGYYLTNNAGSVYLGGEQFPSPVPFAVADDFVTVQPVITYSGSDMGTAIVTN